MDKIETVNRRARLGGVGILSCVVILLSACTPETDKALTGPEAAARGEQIFDLNCGACHGVGGGGPPLQSIMSLTSEERRSKMVNHPVAGQIPQRLRAHELADLREFFEAK